MVRHAKPPSQTWRTFLDNHIPDIAAIDFFTVPTATFRVLFCFIVLRHDRRRVAHFNVTLHPTGGWTAQQIVEAFPYNIPVYADLWPSSWITRPHQVAHGKTGTSYPDYLPELNRDSGREGIKPGFLLNSPYNAHHVA